MQLASHVRVFLLAALLVGCGSTPVGTPAGSSLPTAAGPMATAIVTPAPTALAIPEMTTIEPLVIDVPGSTDLISVTTDGATIWATTAGAVFTIDAATNAVASLPAPSVAGDTTLAIADDGLWMTRWGGDHLYRLDPETGDVLLSMEVEAAVRIAFVGDDLWVGSEATSEMLLINRKTGTIGRTMKAGAYGIAGMGDLWFVHPPSDVAAQVGSGDRVDRVDPDTGAVKASIEVQKEGNCGVYGEFPDNVWVSCFGRELGHRAATRLDPTNNAVATVASLPPCHGGSVVVFNGQAWFVGSFEDAAGAPFGGLLRLNPDTGAIEQFVSIGSADPDPPVVAGGALWIPDEAGHRILRIDPGDLS